MTTLQKNNKGNKHFKPNQPPKENPTCSDEDKNTFSKCLCAKSKTITSSVIPHSLKSNGGKKFKIIY